MALFDRYRRHLTLSIPMNQGLQMAAHRRCSARFRPTSHNENNRFILSVYTALKVVQSQIEFFSVHRREEMGLTYRLPVLIL